MKLNEVYKKPIKDVIEALELSDMKIHTDEDGNIKAIELKYTGKEPESKTNPIPPVPKQHECYF